MYEQVEKPKENKSKTVANSVSQKQSRGGSTFQVVDNRPEAVAQRKLQEIAQNRPKEKQAGQLKSMADNHSAQQQLIQKNEKNTGLPENKITGMENLSDYSMDDVKVQTHNQSLIRQRKKHTNRDVAINLPLQGAFVDEAVAKLRGEGDEEGEELEKKKKKLDNSVCGDSAKHIYSALATGKPKAASGKGLESIGVAIRDASTKANTQVLYKVAAEDIGHQFTVLQQGNEAVLIQSYVNKITLGEYLSLMESRQYATIDAGNLATQLTGLWESLSAFKSDSSEQNATKLVSRHKNLFHVEKTEKEWRDWTWKVKTEGGIIGFKNKGTDWEARFIEGEGEQLNTEVRQKTTSSKCFLTTACTKARGLPDDCYELTTLRQFRDGYMSRLPEGSELIKDYYHRAPRIVEIIEGLPEELEIFDGIYHRVLISIKLIESDRLEEALESYKALVENLSKEYLKK